MTVQSETNKVVYYGNGETKIFPVPFYFFGEEINVYLGFAEDACDKDKYTLRNPQAYTGGEIEFKTAPLADTKITITRHVELKQLTAFLEGEDFPAQDFETALDRLTMGLQELREYFNRAVLIPHGAQINGRALFHCLELFNQYWNRILAVPGYVDKILNSTTGQVTAGDTRLVTSGGVQQYAYSKNMVDAKLDALGQKFYNISVNITADTIAENSGNEDYPYKFNIPLENAEAGHCPVVMFDQTDALSGSFAPYANASDGCVTIYLKNDSSISTIIPLILLM